MKDLYKKLDEAGVEYTKEGVEKSIDNMVKNFGLTKDQAIEALLANMLPKATSTDATISEITEPGKWVNLRVKVVQLWEVNHKSISQVGLIGDETGVIKFLAWTKSELPEVEEGKTYYLRNVVTDEYEEKFSVKLNSTSEIEPFDGEIEVAPNELSINAPVVKIFEDSGVIMRCPTCNRALKKGSCGEHGKIRSGKGIRDLRAKIVLDDGEQAYYVIMGRDVLEEMLQMSMDDIVAKGMEIGDYEFLHDELAGKLLGRYVIINGHKIGNNVFAVEVVL